MKKLTAVLFALIMVLSCFTIMGSAAKTKTIDRIEITTSSEYAGKSYEDRDELVTISTAGVTFDTEYHHNGILVASESKKDEYKKLSYMSYEHDYEDAMEENSYYYLSIRIKAKSGYVFADEITLVMNGEEKTVTPSDMDGELLVTWQVGSGSGTSFIANFFTGIRDFFKKLLSALLGSFASTTA